MTTTQIHVPAENVQVGHIVSNRNPERILEVLNVEPWCEFGKITYKIDIGIDDEVYFKAEIPQGQVLTYTYLQSN